MDEEGKQGSFKGIFIVMLITLLIAFFWERISWIRDGAHSILDPSAGVLLNWNLTFGMSIIIILITLIMTLIQKYATDQATLREMKEEQKKMHGDLKKLTPGSKEHTELSMKTMKFMGPMFKLSMRPIIYTSIPLILFFRWFMDFFNTMGNPKFFGFLSWFWFYLLGSIIFSSILRKIFKVV